MTLTGQDPGACARKEPCPETTAVVREPQRTPSSGASDRRPPFIQFPPEDPAAQSPRHLPPSLGPVWGRRPVSGGCREALPWRPAEWSCLSRELRVKGRAASFLSLIHLEARGAAFGIPSAAAVRAPGQGVEQTCWPTRTLAPRRERPHPGCSRTNTATPTLPEGDAHPLTLSHLHCNVGESAQ